MNVTKKLIALLLSFVMLVGMLPMQALAEETDAAASVTEVASGTCGDNLTWTLDSEGTLVISGEGAMTDYVDTSEVSAPWFGQSVDVKSVIVEEGVTTIGSYAFGDSDYADQLKGVTTLESVSLADSITSIGDFAFQYLSLEQIDLPANLRSIGTGAFAYNPNLTSITIPSSVTTIGLSAFITSNKLKEIYFEGNAPSNISEAAFNKNTATAYYPEGNETWTADVMQNYGGTITWVAYTPEVNVFESSSVRPTEDTIADLPEIGLDTEYTARISTGTQSVWVKLTAPADGTYRFSAWDKEEESPVYIGYIAFNEEGEYGFGAGDGLASSVNGYFDLSEGQTIAVQVCYSNAADIGDIAFSVMSHSESGGEDEGGESGDSNDDPIFGSGSYPDSVDELPVIQLYRHNIAEIQEFGASVWVRFIAPAAGQYDFNAAAGGDTEVYIGRRDPETGASSGTSSGTIAGVELAEGETYILRVRFNDEETCGPITFSVTPSVATDCTNENCAIGTFLGYDDAYLVNGELHLCSRNFPDAAFRAYLQQSGIDADDSGTLSEEECKAIGIINCRNWNISDLAGIQFFNDLSALDCTNCPLVGLDVSMLNSLMGLYCGYDLGHNRVTSLKVPTSLLELDCHNMQLTQPLDLSGLSNLYHLDINNNHYSAEGFYVIGLDADNLPNLEYLDYGNTQLDVDYTQFANLWYLSAYANNITEMDVSMLTKLQVLNIGENHLTYLDLSTNAKLSKVLFGYQFVPEIIENTILACDEGEPSNWKVNVFAYIPEGYQSGISDGSVRDQDGNTPLAFVDGWAYFGTEEAPAGFTYEYLVPANVDAPVAAWPMNVYIGQIDPGMFEGGSGDEGGDTGEDNSQIVISAADMANAFPDNGFLNCVLNNADWNNDGALSTNEIAGTNELYCYDWGISDLTGIEYFTNLEYLYCGNNNLSILDLSENTKLIYLDCSRNDLDSLDVSMLTELRHLYCWNAGISELDVSKNTKLVDLECYNEEWMMDEYPETTNTISALDVSGLTALESLHCGNNQITKLELGNCTELMVLGTPGNPLTELDITNNTKLIHLDYGNTGLDVTFDHLADLETLYCFGNGLTSLDVSMLTKLQYLGCNDNALTSLDVSNNTALVHLDVSYNQLEELDVTALTELTYLDTDTNKINSIDLSKNTKLSYLNLRNNLLTEVDVTALTELEEVLFCMNQLTELDVSKNTKLTSLSFPENQITSIDLTNNPDINWLVVYDNPLEELDVSNLKNLSHLDVDNTELTALDVSQNTMLGNLYCGNCHLKTLDLNNNVNLYGPNLNEQLVCVGAMQQTVDENAGTTTVDLSQFDFIDLSRVQTVENADSFDPVTGIATFIEPEKTELVYDYLVNLATDSSYTMRIRLTTHQWQEATCQAKKTCTLCGATEGEEAACKPGIWTINADGTVMERACVWCGTVQETKPVDLESGELTDLTDTGENACAGQLTEDENYPLQDAILTEAEKEAIANGAVAHVTLTVSDITQTVPRNDRETIENWLGGNEFVGAYLDIDLHKQIGGEEPKQITAVNENQYVTVSIQIPAELLDVEPGVVRNFYIVRVSDGNIYGVGDYFFNKTTKTFTFQTNHFSTYAVVYSEETYRVGSWDCPEVLETLGTITKTLDESNERYYNYTYIAPSDGYVSLTMTPFEMEGVHFNYNIWNNADSSCHWVSEYECIVNVTAGDEVCLNIGLSFDDESYVTDAGITFTLEFTSDEFDYAMDGYPVLSGIRQNDATGLLYSWTAVKDGTVTFQKLANMGSDAELIVYQYSNDEELIHYLSETEDGILEIAVSAGDELMVQLIAPEENSDEEGNTWTNYNEATVLWSGEFKGYPVAQIGETSYATVKEALEAAVSGDTVVMIADSHEEDSNLTIDEGVTLNVGSYDLYARSLTGFTGSSLTGVEYQRTNDYGKVYLPASTRLVLSGTVLVNKVDTQRDMFPVWDATKECYIFGGARFASANNRLSITEDQIHFEFTPVFKSQLISDYLKDGISENGLKIVLRLTWPSKDGNAIAQQDFVYSEAFAKIFFNSTNAAFTFDLFGYDAMYIEPEQLTMNVMIVGDSGMIYRSNDIIYTAE